MTVRNGSLRLYDVYFINRNSLPTNNVDKEIGDIILANNYKAIYDTIKNIQAKVNDYAIFDSDKNDVKFDQTIDNFEDPDQPVKGEIITADKISNDPIGRNYMNICIESMNKLY